MSTTFHLNPALPAWIITLVACLLLGVIYWSARILIRKRLPRRSITILCCLRVVAVALFVAGLLQPIISYNRIAHRKPSLSVVIDTSKSMGLAKGETTRLQSATDTLRTGPFADHLRQNFTVTWFEAHPNSSPIDVKDLDRLEATGETTRLADSLRSAIQRSDGKGEAHRILLVSDGADHGSSDLSEDAARLGVPIDVLLAGTASLRDEPVSVVEVQASTRVLLGSETRLLARVRGTPKSFDRILTLHLHEDGTEVQTAPLPISSNRGDARIEISHRPNSAGLKRYTLQVSGADAADGQYSINVQVLDRTHEVLILEDTWRWEFKYLKRSIEDDPSFRFAAILARSPATVMQFGSPDRKVPFVGMPQNAADIAAFDLFILGDVDPARWPRGLAADIARAVKEEGKSLVLIAGPNLGKIAEQPELHSLLPVELSVESGKPIEDTIEVKCPDAFASRFFTDPALEHGKLPSLERIYPPIRKRPAARVLLESTKLANSYGPLIVMAEQTVGRGRALFLGTDALYQWQTLASNGNGTTPHRAFWQQALRALAPIKPVNDATLWLFPERTRVEAGQPVTIWAETRGVVGAGTLAMHATLADEKPAYLSSSPSPSRPNWWSTTLTPRKPGTYRIQASARVDGQPAGDATTVVEVTPSAELTETTPDADTLWRIAHASGGKVVNPSDPATWPGETASEVEERVTLEFWGDGLILALLSAVLGLDWLHRLLRGYV